MQCSEKTKQKSQTLQVSFSRLKVKGQDRITIKVSKSMTAGKG